MAYYGNMLVDPRTNAKYVQVLQTGPEPQLRVHHSHQPYGSLDDSQHKPHQKFPIALSADRFYSTVKYATAVTTLALLAIVIIGSSILFSTNNNTSALFFVNTFLAQYDNANNLTWPVLTNTTWSSLARSTSPYTDVKFEQKYECFFEAGIAGPGGGGVCSTFTSAADWTNCLKLNYNATLSICATTNSYNYKNLWPTSAQYQTCIANNFNITRQQYNAFDMCLKTDLWPLFEIAQDIDSPYLLGSYNWMLLLSTGLFVYTMFALWTCSPLDGAEETAVIQYGKPTGRWTRMSMTWSAMAVVGSLIWAIITLCLVYRASTFAYNTGANAAMNNVGAGLLVFFVSFLALVYFALEFLEFFDGYKRENATHFSTRSIESRLNEYTPNPSKAYDSYTNNPKEAAKEYTPILMVAWADAYMCDALIYTGLIGATAHVSTADVYSVFGWILLYRLIQSGAVRLFYEAYIKNDVESSTVNLSRNAQFTDANFATKIAALAYHLAATVCLIEVCFIIFNPNKAFVDYALLICMVVFGLLIPEFLRTFGHLYVVWMNGSDHSIPILLFSQFIWWWDVAVRLVLFCFVLWAPSGTSGTYPFLSDQYTYMTAALAFAGT